MIRSVTHRIAVWYGAIFILLFLLLFYFVYRDLSSHLVMELDEQLIEKALRNEWYAKDVPLEKIQNSIDFNTKIEGIKKVSYWLCDSEGNLVYGSNADYWKPFQLDSELIRKVSRSDKMGKQETRKAFEGMRIRWIGRESSLRLGFFESGQAGELKYRVGYIRLKDGKVLVCANNRYTAENFLQRLVRTFGIFFGIAVILGSLVGYLLARHAMAGVKRVTRVASSISDGNMDERVRVNSDGIEIEELAHQFNVMLDRIQLLLVGLKQVSDDIAHDLRTPVTRIRTLAEINATSSKDAECRCQMGVIVEECDQLIEMINTMLEITQTNSGVVQFEMETVDLGEVLAAGYELFQAMAEDKSQQFTFENPGQRFLVEGHRSRLQRVVSNLLDNAIKFTPEGGTISMKLKTPTDGDALISVEIVDSGPGIPPDELERIFDRFYRRDPSRSVEGNGLGLCLARAIMRAHGGDITVKSEEGKGSCFTIVVPVYQ